MVTAWTIELKWWEEWKHELAQQKGIYIQWRKERDKKSGKNPEGKQQTQRFYLLLLLRIRFSLSYSLAS
jgi:hypothetical protein